MKHEAQRTIDAVWRIESAKIIAAVARLTRDVGVAEEMAQDALVAALEHWPAAGIPDNPGAWLMTTAKNRALDRLRQAALHRRKQEELGSEGEARGDHVTPDFTHTLDDRDAIDDDLLRLIFTACHPVLPREAQVALTLKLLAGLTTAEIARAYLQTETTIAQRIVRAKRTLSGAQVPFEVPHGAQLQSRMDGVLEVIYLIFNEGYSATLGDDWMRPALCEEAQRLARMLAQLAPAQREAHGLAALLELQASRLQARIDARGQPILLPDQDRTQWDPLLIRRGLAALAQAQSLGGEAGPYELQAAIAACHAGARTAADTDWRAIVRLYDRLLAITSSPVVALNRAVALSMAEGPAAALPLVEALAGEGRLDDYHLLPAVHGDLLQRLGRMTEARAQFEKAAGLARNQRERALLLERARAALP
ncbi:MAG: RNA polymerase sigma factor [Steroidobacteraceae bacterium]